MKTLVRPVTRRRPSGRGGGGWSGALRVAAIGAALVAWPAFGAGAPPAPFTPRNDQEVVERLPLSLRATDRDARARLASDPSRWPLAVSIARAALERARRSGDPRELGAAQAALAPWWHAADPPPAVRLMRATVRQSQHAFDAALVDLNALVVDPSAPLAIVAQAGLTRATVLQVTGRWAKALAGCRELQSPRFLPMGAALRVTASACEAELIGLMGEPLVARARLAALAQAPTADPRWLALLQAEQAQRLGDHTAAARGFAAATANSDDVYARAAYADWLLERDRPRDVIALVPPDPAAPDALRLRRAIALHRVLDPAAEAEARLLGERFDAVRRRGDLPHLREEARLALEIDGDARRALDLAEQNWQQQKEPADAVLLWRCARAAGVPGPAAEALRRWSPHPGRIDVRLADVGSRENT